MIKGCLIAVGALAAIAFGGALTLAAIFIIAALGFESGGPVATREIASQDANRTPQWSSDGQFLVVNLGYHIFKVNANGYALSRLPAEGDAGQFSPTLSPAGKIAYLDGSENQARIATMDDNGEQIKHHWKSDHRRRNGMPQWSPNGTHIAFTTIANDDRGNLINEAIIMDDLGKVTSKHTYAFGLGGGTPVWSNDSAKVAFSWLSRTGHYAITIAYVDGSSTTVIEAPIRSELETPTREPLAGLSSVAWSTDDQTIYYVLKQSADSPATLISTNISTSKESNFVTNLGDRWIEHIHLSPNGDILLFVATKIRDGKFTFQNSVHLVNTRGVVLNDLFTDPIELRANPGEIQASWSPDGKRIAVTNNERSPSLFTVALDGSDVRSLVIRDTNDNYFPAHAEPAYP